MYKTRSVVLIDKNTVLIIFLSMPKDSTLPDFLLGVIQTGKFVGVGFEHTTSQLEDGHTTTVPTIVKYTKPAFNINYYCL